MSAPAVETSPVRPSSAPAPAEVLVAAEGLGVVRDHTPILDGVALHVHRGEIVTLVGPNGAGKTTLVRVLLGLERPDRGRVVRRPGLVVGYCPQRLALDPVLPLSARRFLTLAGRYPPDRLTEVVAEVGIAELLDRQVHRLSGGEFHRLLLARALLRTPDLLVLDEPLSGVDYAGQVELYRLLRRVRDRYGCGILLVSHDLHLVFAATDRVVCLNRRLQCVGTPLDVARDPAFQRLFGTRMAEAFAPYVHDHGGEVRP